MRESRIESALVREVVRRGGLCPKWVSPGLRGVPDRIVIMPGNRTMYVETKAPGKPLQPLQKKRAEELRARGCRVFKIDSLAEVKWFAEEVLDSEI